MADTKRSREEQARNEEERQRERALEEARERADEAEPAADEQMESPRECHRRGCTEAATFLVLERYREDTGHGVVEAEAALCREHTAEERPSNLDGAYADYVFRVEPIPGTGSADTA